MHRKSRSQSRIQWSFGSMALPLFLLALFLLTATAGCGGAEATVSGTVTLDGSPLEQGTVMFVPTQPDKARAATGVISGGDYWVQVAKTGGLSPGEYRVRITASAPPKPNPHGGPPAPGKLLTPKRYADTETSGLQFQVEPGSNSINLELTSE